MIVGTTKNGAIYSEFGGDPDLGDLVEMFVEVIPNRIAALEQAFGRGDWESLRRAAHQLKGAGGSYGFNALTPLAAAVESAVRDRRPEGVIRKALQELIDSCQQLRAGQPV